MLLVVFSATLAVPQFGGVWTAAPTNKRMAPRAIRARPGQFDLRLKPAAGRRGSRVRSATAERDRLPLSRARQIGWAAMKSTPLTTSSAPSQNMINILASRLPRRARPLVSKLPTMHAYHQAADRCQRDLGWLRSESGNGFWLARELVDEPQAADGATPGDGRRNRGAGGQARRVLPAGPAGDWAHSIRGWAG
jgi:hypothetical protein